MKREYSTMPILDHLRLFFIRTNYKDALKYGFYEFQTIRDWYREVTADVGMHVEPITSWIRRAALLATPVAPHFAEHIWMGENILNTGTSIQLARWPTPSRPVDRAVVESGAYMRETVKAIRDAEAALARKISKAKGNKKGGEKEGGFDARKPKSVRIYVATDFPAWQDQCVQAVKEAYVEETGSVDDARVRELLAQAGLGKDKRAMPFVQAFKVGGLPHLFLFCNVFFFVG
jgi:leucyl-tRNA synthetase